MDKGENNLGDGPLIDLGEVGRAGRSQPTTADRWAGGATTVTGAPAARRWRSAAILTIAVLATVAGAGPFPALPDPAYLEVGFEAQLVLDGDLLFVFDGALGGDPADSSTGGQSIAAYEVPGGDLRWQVPVPEHGDGLLRREVIGMQPVGDLLLVGSVDLAGVLRTVAVDTADGSVRWLADGQLVGATSDGEVALWSLLSVVDPESQEAVRAGATVQVVETGSGRTRWAATTSAQGEFVYRFDGDRLAEVIELESGDRVRVRDARTGQVHTAGRIETEQPVEPWRSWAVADVLVRATDDTLSAFDLDGLTLRWSVPAAPPSGITSCASLLCVTHPGGGVRGLEPTDAVTRWVNDDWDLDSAFGRYLLIAPGRQAGLPSTLRLVVDPATGEPVTSDPYWVPFAVTGDGWLGLRHDPFQSAVWVARITPGAPRPRVVLRLADARDSCQASAEALVCRHVSGGLGIWRLPD